MYRKILFKGKTYDNEWVKGCLIYNFYSEHYDNIPYIGYKNRCERVIPETICQCTEFYDKYKREIWENDIIEDSNNNRYVIVFKDGKFYAINIYKYPLFPEGIINCLIELSDLLEIIKVAVIGDIIDYSDYVPDWFYKQYKQ